ncbi:MAG: WXG100 family type VII secretion target [Mycobacterium sp.]
MASILQAQLEALATTADSLADQADQLENELAQIVQHWNDLSAKWTGKAASAFEPPWNDWHDGAKVVASILAEESELLRQSVALLVEHETNAQNAIGGVYRSGRNS